MDAGNFSGVVVYRHRNDSASLKGGFVLVLTVAMRRFLLLMDGS